MAVDVEEKEALVESVVESNNFCVYFEGSGGSGAYNMGGDLGCADA